MKDRNRSIDRTRLSPAELRVLDLLCEGLTNPEIGERLFISRRTVQSHLYNIFKKFGVRSRTQLVALAVREGLDGSLSSTDVSRSHITMGRNQGARDNGGES